MFVTRIKSLPAVVVLALGGIGAGVGLSTDPVAVAQEKTGEQALDGLWGDVESEGEWLRFEGSTVTYHPAGKRERMEWSCRYNVASTPMTIDIFQKDGTAHGIFVIERDTLFIALAKGGMDRPTRIQRDEATTLFVLKRYVQSTPPRAKDEPMAAAPQQDTPQVVSGQMIVHGILESVDAERSVVTVKAVVGNDASAVLKLNALIAGKKPAKGGATNAPVKGIDPDNLPKLAHVSVRADGDGVIGTGVGFARQKLTMADLKAGQVVRLQLAADRTTGFVVNFVRVLSDKEAGKP